MISMRLLKFEGRVLNLTDWAKELGFRREVLQNRLTRGWSTREAFTTPVGNHGVPHGEAGRGEWTPEYVAWRSMKARCTMPGSSGYYKYGARGIQVYGGWLENFPAFLEEVGRRPSSLHSLERKDNTKGYEPGNVRWATAREQARNRRSSSSLTIGGETKTIAEWAEVSGVPYYTFYRRVRKGWTGARLLSTEDGRARGTLRG